MVVSPRSFGDDIPGMEGLGTGEVTLLASHLMVRPSKVWSAAFISGFSVSDITVICPWEAFNHLELHELAQYGII